MSEKVSNTPWSNFSNSDYSDEQYARACLLDRGPSAGTAKQRYSIPVREPSGVLNRNGCHAAAAVLSSTGGTGSARGNKVSATPEQISAARSKLVSLYRNALGEEVPEGLKHSLELVGEEFLSHHGVLGMKWGHRKAENAHPDAARVASTKQKIKKSGLHTLSNQELRDVIQRTQLEQQTKHAMTSRGSKFLARQLEISGQQQVQRGLAKAGAKAFA